MLTSVFISIDKPFYFAGDTVNGHVYLNSVAPILGNELILKFKGWESVRWFTERIVGEQQRPNIQSHLIFQSMFKIRMDSSDSEDHPGDDDSFKYRYVQEGGFLKEITKHTGQRKIANFESILFNFEGQFVPPGQYAFPFSFKTGENYPASYMDKSTKNNRRGRIKYEMQAFVRAFGARLLLVRSKQEIVIRQSGAIKNDHQIMDAKVVSCCCIDQGRVKIECYFQKNGYTPGEEAKIYCKCDNTQGKTQVNSVDVSLVNEIVYTSHEGVKQTFHDIIFHKSFQGLGVGEKGERDQNVRIINNQIGSNEADIKPTARGSCLNSTYHLRVQASLAAFCTCCSQLPVVKQPVLIFPFIPVNYYFKQPPNWAPTIMPMKVFTVSMGSMAISMGGLNVNMNVNVPPPPRANINVNMNVPPPPSVNVNMNSNMQPMNSQMNVQMNTGMGMNMQMNTNVNNNMHHSHHNNMNVKMSGPNVNMSVNNNMGMGMGMGMGMNTKTTISGNGGGVSMEMRGMGPGHRMF